MGAVVNNKIWNYVNEQITNIPIDFKEYADFKEIETRILSAIKALESTESIDEDENKFRACFGRLNFRINFLSLQLDDQSYSQLKTVNETIETLAKKHRISRRTPTKNKFLNVVRKIADMSSISLFESLPLAKRRTKILSEEYWKEYFDTYKRHPKTLDKFFNVWKIYGHSAKQSFWDYLKKIEDSGLAPELGNVNERVLYLDEKERQKYAVSVEMTPKGVAIKDSSHQVLPDGVYITVLGPDNRLYAAKKQPGKFQHASFFAGKSVISAGLLVIENGVLKNFISQSGHYKPEKEEMFKFLDRMEKLGIDIGKFHLIYGTGGELPTIIANPKEWTEFQDFISKKEPEKVTMVANPDLLSEINSENKIDRRAAKKVQQLGGGYLNKELDAVVPIRTNMINIQWEQKKNNIARVIGILPYPATLESMLWSNSAASPEVLLMNAEQAAPTFQKICRSVCERSGGKMNYGPDDRHLLKTLESLKRKVNLDADVMGTSKEDSLSKIGDALRGTLILEDPKSIPLAVDLISKEVEKEGGSVIFKNLWAEERQSGYVGVHAKILLPLPGERDKKNPKTIIVELQIHLKQIMDGTESCVKEREHLIYEKVRTGQFKPNEIAATSRLLYLTAMDKIKV